MIMAVDGRSEYRSETVIHDDIYEFQGPLRIGGMCPEQFSVMRRSDGKQSFRCFHPEGKNVMGYTTRETEAEFETPRLFAVPVMRAIPHMSNSNGIDIMSVRTNLTEPAQDASPSTPSRRRT
jgi:hypothetical protein